MAEEKSAQEIIQTFEQLKQERSTWEDEYQEITEQIFPRRSVWTDNKGRASRSGGLIYDGTPISALNLLANGLVGYLVSPATRWFKLRPTQDELLQIRGARQWLEIVENLIYDEFNRSNFYEEIVEYFRDGGSIGTATIYVQEDIGRRMANYSCRHPKEIYIAEDRFGYIDTVFRRFFPTAKELEEEFGREALSDGVQNLCERSPYERVEIIHAVYPRKKRNPRKKGNRDMKFASAYVEGGSNHKIRERGYERLPYVVWRWSTNSDEVYGRGPGYDALVDVKRLNRLSRDMLKQSQMAVDPPLAVPEKMRGKVNWVPRGLNYYQNPNELPVALNPGMQFQVGLDREQHMQQIIEKHFMTDFFLMLEQAPKEMTATEVMERQSEKAAVLGTVIGRISSEFLDPIIDITFDIAMKGKRLPPPPPEFAEAMYKTNGGIEIDYLGPLAQAQKRFHVKQGAQQSLEAVSPIMQINPQVADLINWDQLTMEILHAYGMPQKAIVDLRDVQKIRQQRAVQQAAAMQQQQAQQLIDKYPMDKQAPPDSPMEEIGNQLRDALKGGNGGAA